MPRLKDRTLYIRFQFAHSRPHVIHLRDFLFKYLYMKEHLESTPKSDITSHILKLEQQATKVKRSIVFLTAYQFFKS